MKYSLFRFKDVLEGLFSYLLCFGLNSALTKAVQNELAGSTLLYGFFKELARHQSKIVVLMTCIVVIFHYQLLSRKKTEVFCRILVGDTVPKIKGRYVRDHFLILTGAFLVSLLFNIFLKIEWSLNLPLIPLFVIYILFATRKVAYV